MTSNSTRLAALAADFAQRGGKVDERIDQVVLRGEFSSEGEQAEWIALSGQDVSPFVSVSIRDRWSNEMSASDPFVAAGEVTIIIVKPNILGTAPFLFEGSAALHLETERGYGFVRVASLDARAGFQTRGLEVGTWDFGGDLTSPPEPVAINPRKFVRDYVPEREIVDDLSPWLITLEPAVESDLFAGWRKQAGRRLLGALVNGASLSAEHVMFHVSGPPVVDFNANRSDLSTAWRELTNCAEWVYIEGHDREVRHVLFVAELARSAQASVKFEDTARRALEGAKASYQAHINSSSRETLKALGDLRKTIIDETQKVSQRAQDMTGNLWRDIAVSASPFVLKVLVDAGKAASAMVSGGFYFAAAFFIVMSYMFQRSINGSFLANQQDAREAWLRTLYSHISESEREAIAGTPVRDAVKSYEKIRDLVGGVYGILALILCAFGISTLGAGRSAAPEPAPTSASSGATAEPVAEVSAPDSDGEGQ